MSFHPTTGVFYVDHLRKKNQPEDPRVEWRNLQINMLNSYLKQAEGTGMNKSALSTSLATSNSQKELSKVGLSAYQQRNIVSPRSPTCNVKPPLFNRASLEQSLSDAKLRVAQLKRELDANYNLLTIIDKYYKKTGPDAAAVEV